MEFNKLFAAVLVAGVAAMLSGFVAKKVVHVGHPHENAYKIEVVENAGAGASAAAEAVAEPVLALLAAADVAKGQNAVKVCAACHTFNKGEPNRVGPNLYGIIGAKHAHMDGFAYSDAMKALHDKPWDYKAMNEFLWNPKKAIPGTKMSYAGMKKPEDRAAVIAYLRTLADAPVALPSEAEIAAEAPKPEETAAPAADGEAAAATEEKPAGSKEEAKESPATEKPATEKPASEKAEDNKADDMKSEDKKPEDKKAEDGKDADKKKAE